MALLDTPSTLSKSSNELNTNPNIRVLVCTANLGNEAPNVESMNEMIPNDGDTKSVIQNQRYPIRVSREKKLTSNAFCEKPEYRCFEKSSKGNHGVDNASDKFHIIAIGMQEATFELTEKLVESLPEQKEIIHDCDRGQDDTRFLHQILSNLLPSYTRAVSYQRGQMRLMIFYNQDEISLNVLSVKAQNTGKGGRDNKGGIVAECDINSGTRISFLTAHLEAHEGLEKYNTRCCTLSDIFQGTVSKLANSYCDVSMTSHFTFAMGDMNFRTRIPNYEIGSDEHCKAAHILAEKKDWGALNEHDELMHALRNKECLVGFLTPTCDFPPTFKTERKAGYSYLSNRSPSYTDRILYKANHNLSERINLKAYGPIDSFTTSDHKPVRGAFEIQLNQRLTFRSLLTKSKNNIRIFPSSTFMRILKTVGIRNVITKFRAKDKAHFSISSIGCVIAQGPISNSSDNPSLCISFTSTPSDAIEAENASTTWKNCCQKNNSNDSLTMKWPHTQAISNTLHLQLENKIKFKIRSHSKQGTPVDLTGAMLHILVHNVKDNLKLIGSCSLNLASLMIDYMGTKEMIEKSKGFEQSQGKSQSFRSTNFKNVEEILMKNGKEVGKIKLNIDTQ